MKDQAEKLRKLMNKEVKKEKQPIAKKNTEVIAITSGKGGVGKSNFAVNLAISIKRLGYTVLVLDADFGMANVEILTGINIKYTFTDLITTNEDVYNIISKGPEGVEFISGGSGFHNLSILSQDNIERLLNELEKLESYVDFLIIDTGAGVSNVVLDFVMAADDVILISTPDPTSIMDGYTMLKALIINGYKGNYNVVTNIVNSRTEAYNTFDKLNKASNSFLNQELNFLGFLENSNIVTKAVKNQRPFVLSSPTSSISKRVNIMALKFINPSNKDNEKVPVSFTAKLKKLIFRKGDSNASRWN